MDELIARIEGAEMSPRELDGAIWCRLHGEDAVLTPDLPWYMEALEDAVSLWPAGWYVQVTQIRFGMWQVKGGCGDKSVNAPADVESVAGSEAVARTIAALRARAA